MMKRMAGQSRVIGFEVDLHLIEQAVFLQKAVDGCGVVVVLMLGRLLRLGLDQQDALEPDLVLVFDDHAEEAAELRAFALEVGIQQSVVAFASTSFNEAPTTETMR